MTIKKPGPKSIEDIKLRPDAWPRFERFVTEIAKAGPKHRAAPKSKQRQKSKNIQKQVGKAV